MLKLAMLQDYPVAARECVKSEACTMWNGWEHIPRSCKAVYTLALPMVTNVPASCRDMLDSSPGVNWGDIAGLAEAKRVLQENVILPLYMPEFFQGIRRPVKVRL